MQLKAPSLVVKSRDNEPRGPGFEYYLRRLRDQRGDTVEREELSVSEMLGLLLVLAEADRMPLMDFYRGSNLSLERFLNILMSMRDNGLLETEDEDVLLTKTGKSLAAQLLSAIQVEDAD